MTHINHFPLLRETKKNDIINTSNDIKLYNNEKIQIITTYTDIDKAVLINQLEKNEIGYINAANDVTNFIKAFKPLYYFDALKNVKSEYVLIIDSYDTIINSLNNIETCLNTYQKDILYSAFKFCFPTFFEIDFSTPDDNELKHLNSGVLLGKTEKVKEFYDKLSSYIKNNYDSCEHWLKDYEQYWLCKFLLEENKYIESIGIDYNEILVKSEFNV